ncbi:MAG TPA: hydrolase 1, exosortase A system-associated [Allosphingosinicella sp.]|nr:hydrolase 1, exosortase A system-associated [Allosphingosinicella sp.]
MRRLLSFTCDSAALGASLDGDSGRVGVLIVTGGTQTRIGSHRMFARLAASLAEAGYPCFRFDRRGVGDSEGLDSDFRGSSDDVAAAAAAFRDQIGSMERIIGFGLCDGATALALYGAATGLSGLILVNPWLVEAEANAPPPAAIRHHYRQRLLSIEGWQKLISGSVSYRKLFKGIAKIVTDRKPSVLADEVAQALAAANLPVELILALDDATAVAAADVWRSSGFAARVGKLPSHSVVIETDSHTFARPRDSASLLSATLSALGRLRDVRPQGNGRSGGD